MSGSFASCRTRIVKSVVTEHEESARITSTKGENGTHSDAPVFPPTQLPQLSRKAAPPKTPLQSVTSIWIVPF